MFEALAILEDWEYRQVKADATDYLDVVVKMVVCPYCGDAVVKRQGSERTRSETHFKVQPHFAHRPLNQTPQSLDDLDKICELRSLSIGGQEHYSQFSATARHQRLSFIQERLWAFVVQVHEVPFNPERINRSMRDLIVSVIHDAMQKDRQTTHVHVDYEIDLWMKTDIDEIRRRAKDKDIDDSITERFIKQMNILRSQEDILLHRAICHDILNFVTSSSGKGFLTKFTDWWFAHVSPQDLLTIETYIRISDTLGEHNYLRSAVSQILSQFASYMVYMLTGIPWVEVTRKYSKLTTSSRAKGFART